MTQNQPSSDRPNRDAEEIDLSGLPNIIDQIVDTMRRGKVEHLVLSLGSFHLDLTTSSDAPAGKRSPSLSAAGEVEDGDEADAGHHVVTSPMIGTFYAAPAPGESPFVRPGDSVAQGDTIGIVEAMKIMNEISADRSGTVLDVIAEDGETVEYGSPLVRLQIQS